MEGNVYNQEKVYIVDFSEAIGKFRKALMDDTLPTIDQDVVYWQVLAVFEKVLPMQALHQVANYLVSHDHLFTKEEYFETTRWQQEEADRFLRKYLYEAIVELGVAMHRKLQEVGMVVTGTERYKHIGRPLTDDAYLFKRTRA